MVGVKGLNLRLLRPEPMLKAVETGGLQHEYS